VRPDLSVTIAYILLRWSLHTLVHQRTSDNLHKIRFCLIHSYLVYALCYLIIHLRYTLDHTSLPFPSLSFPSGFINSTYAHLHWIITRCVARSVSCAFVRSHQCSRMIDRHLVQPNDSDSAVVIAHSRNDVNGRGGCQLRGGQ